jgi:hypothetical protein
MAVPAGAVVKVSTWQPAQPIFSKIAWPCITSVVMGPRGGTLSVRVNVVNASMSSTLFGSVMPVVGWHTCAASVGFNGFVIPISFMKASPANNKVGYFVPAAVN